MKLRGIISDKLRAKFPPGHEAWTPQRPASPTVSSKIPKGVSGTPMTGRKNKK